MITKKQLKEFRKKECFCGEMDVDFCSKCNNPIEDQKPCIVCIVLNDLIKFAKRGREE